MALLYEAQSWWEHIPCAVRTSGTCSQGEAPLSVCESQPSGMAQESAKTLNSTSSSLALGFHMWKCRGEQLPSARHTSPSKQWSDLKQLSFCFARASVEKQIPFPLLLLLLIVPSAFLSQPLSGKHCVPAGQVSFPPENEHEGVALHSGSQEAPHASGKALDRPLLPCAGG